MLRLRDRLTDTVVSFDITGVFVPRQRAGAADSYWKLSYIPASGRSASYGSTTYGPLVVSQAALGPALTMFSGSRVAQPDMAAFREQDLNPVSACVATLARSLPDSSSLSGAQLVTSLPSVLAAVARLLATQAGNCATIPRRAIAGQRASIRCSRWLPRSRWPLEASPPCACFHWLTERRTRWPSGAGDSPPRWPRGSSAECRSAKAERRCCLPWRSPWGPSRSRNTRAGSGRPLTRLPSPPGSDVQVDLAAPLKPGGAGAVTGAKGVTHAMAVMADNTASPGEVIAVDTTQAAQVVQLRADESALPPGSLFGAIAPASPLPGAVLSTPAGTIQLTATLSPDTAVPARQAAELAAQLGPVAVTLTILDQTGAAYQVAAGTLAADGHPHRLVAPLGGGGVRYPLRVAAITATFLLPLPGSPELALTVHGLPVAGWVCLRPGPSARPGRGSPR